MAGDSKRTRQEMWRDMFRAHSGVTSTETLPETMWIKKIFGAITGVNIENRTYTYIQALRKLVVAVGGSASEQDNELRCFQKIAERVSDFRAGDDYDSVNEVMHEAAWSPRRLFSAGDNGGWWPIYPGVNLYQDTAKTSFATIAGDPVRVIADLSGLGNDFVAPGNAERPLLQTDGDWYLDFDGVNDEFRTGTGINLQANRMLFGANAVMLATSGTYVAVILSKAMDGTWSPAYGTLADDPGALADMGCVVGSYSINNAPFLATSGIKYSLVGYSDADTIRSRRDGVVISTASCGSVGVITTETNMGRAVTSFYSRMRMYECIFLNTYREFSSMERWLELRR